MKRLVLAIGLVGILCGGAAEAAGEQVIPVWPGVAPGSESWTYPEASNVSERDKTLNLTNIVKPAITVYPAAKPNGTAMLVIPGGGFVNLGYGKEGEAVAHWLNSIGFTAFVLKYRLAKTGDAEAKDSTKLNARIDATVPLAVNDALQAVRILRSRAGEWGIKKFGVIGFSAGGLLTVGTAVWLEPPLRPDFIVPVYPAVPREYTVKADSPPAFIVLADDDRYGTDWSIGLYKAWHSAHAPAELHIYAQGNHGFALRKTGIPTDSWADRLQDWMKLMGFLPVTPK